MCDILSEYHIARCLYVYIFMFAYLCLGINKLEPKLKLY